MPVVRVGANWPAWSELVAHEPRLNDVLEECRNITRADWRDYERMKRRVAAMVGHNGAEGFLREPKSYEVAIGVITEALGI